MRKFGIEIECEISESAAVAALNTISGLPTAARANGYHSTRDYSTWRVEYDSSVSQGCEIVSPVLQGEDGFEQIRKVVKALSQAGGGINRTCGLHVHVAASDLGGQWLKNIMSRYDANADAIDAFMPPSRRATGYSGRQYCGRITDGVNSSRFTRAQTVADVRACFGNRYVVLNLVPLTRLGTIEFRQHGGSLNADKIINWVGFCQQFVTASRPSEDSVVAPTVNPSAAELRLGRVSTVGLTPKRRRLVRALQNAGLQGCTTAELAGQSGFSEGSVIATISYLRSQRGLLIRKRQGFYILNGGTSAPTPVVAAPVVAAPLARLWTGIDPTIAQFYAERTAELSPHG
jgi:hypothetical protein